MPRKLTPRSSLLSLKREAKRWLEALRENIGDARARLAGVLPNAPALPTLRDVQHALALEHGVPGWTALRNLLDSRSAEQRTRDDLAERGAWFAHNACPDHHVRGLQAHARARRTTDRMLARWPELAHDSFSIAVASGDLERVTRALAANHALANARGGPKNWEPLLYLCFSRLSLAAARENAVAIAQLLLANGADPRVWFDAGDSQYTPLVGVIGEGEEDRPAHPQRDALARLLLDHGADPYDRQVHYNIHFHGEVLWFYQLSHELSVKAGRQADWDDPDWRMFDMGRYGCGARFAFRMAVRDNNLELAEWMLANGANPNAAPARDKRLSRRSVHDEALSLGHTELAALLVRHGAIAGEVALDDEERYIAACLRLDRVAAQAMIVVHPEFVNSTPAIFAAARRNRPDAVALILDLGTPPGVAEADGQTALHVAAAEDAVEAAQVLVARGAALDPRESNFDAIPLGWAIWGGKSRMIEYLGGLTRDVWELTNIGRLDRLREVLAEEPARAKAGGDGETPLMWLPDDEPLACAVIELLVAHGANPRARNSDGRTAADIAERRGMFQVAGMLRTLETA